MGDAARALKARLSLGSGLRGAVTRLVLLLVAACALVLVATIPIGLLTSAGVDRSVSLGFYLLGAFLVMLGFLGGSRGPYRSADQESEVHRVRLGRRLRRATRDELHEAISVSAIAVVIGLVLVVIGVLVDTRYKLL